MSRAAPSGGSSHRKIADALKEEQLCLDANDTLVVCAFELPLKVYKGDDGQLHIEKQKSLVMPLLHNLRKQMRVPVRFVGWAGYVCENEAEKRQLAQLLEPLDCVPIHIEQEQINRFIDFCHASLRPVFHNVIAMSDYTRPPFDSEGWKVYQGVNRLFADATVHEASETDPIWVHDYHLLLCPQYIVRRIRRANVGIFLHVPFPSSEIFRCLPIREEILRGMLCADLVGFHFFEYARHFLVVCKRLLGLEHHFRVGGYLELDYGGRHVMLRIGHVQLQYDELRQQIEQSEKTRQSVAEITKRYTGKFVFASVDRCEPLGGIHFKFEAFRHFLTTYPYAAQAVVLVQYVYLNRRPDDKYARQLAMMSESINEEFGTDGHPVIELTIGDFSVSDKYALFQAADCLLDCSVRDGLNLIPFEYICCRRDHPAPLILSEFTGCCRSLATAIRVNPWKVEDVAQALDRAVNTPQDELRDRFLRDQMFLQRNSTLQWADEFLVDLRRARKPEAMVYVSWGFGHSYKVVGLDQHFQYLDADFVVQCFRLSRRAVFFFDHEGTLAPDRRRITAVPGHETLSASGAAPSTQVQHALAAICTAGHTVVILSGRGRDQLDFWFGGIPDLGLCAEHGFYYKVKSLTGDEWVSADSDQDFTWKQIVLQLMQQYVKRTQGAFVENKGSALVFQYRDADPDFGSWQAKELASYLEELLFRESNVQVISGKGYVEVKLKDVSKGQAVRRVLKGLSEKASPTGAGPDTPIDFILCIGDDRSDEAMFPVVNSFFGETSTSPPPRTPTTLQSRSLRGGELSVSGSVAGGSRGSNMSQFSNSADRRPSGSKPMPIAFSVTVGKKPSEARYYVNDTDDVSELLESLQSA